MITIILLLLCLYLGALAATHFKWEFRTLVKPAEKLGEWIGGLFK